MIALLGLVPALIGLVGKFLGVKTAQVQAGQKQTDDIAGVQEAEAPFGGWITPFIRAMYGMIFAIYIFKVVVYDKVMGLGVTDALDPHLWMICLSVIGWYTLDHLRGK